jgi:nitroimidazol reductase NimA-like FMN-containing flavoprotein (pyridoxamine 5'-phosphate oxidase superfamily)
MIAGPHLELLDDDECLAVLARHPIGRVGLSAGALPVVLPVNYVLDGQTVLFRTESGLKLEAARQGAVACIEVDDYDVMSHSGCSVLATGRLGIVTEPSRLQALHDLPLRAWAAPSAPYLIELPIELLSGRRITGDMAVDVRT